MERRTVQIWLLICLLLVGVMVWLGGITRLTGSGLSMVAWEPLSGVLPPLSQADWQAEFTRYQQSPEFRHVYPDMGVEGFKRIFWLEYMHRLTGRIIGMIFLLPLVWFWRKKALSSRASVALLGIFSLGGLQAVLGWLMVQSGLIENPHVSPVMLAMHLALGACIFALLTIAYLAYRAPPFSLRRYANARSWLVALLFVQLIYGALVAGNHAGLRYNDWPLMEGQWLPDGLFSLSPWWDNFVHNTALVQLTHRLLAYLLVGVIMWHFVRNRFASQAIHAACFVCVLQVGLGIATLMLHVPIWLASLHQMVAFLLLFFLISYAQERR